MPDIRMASGDDGKACSTARSISGLTSILRDLRVDLTDLVVTCGSRSARYSSIFDISHSGSALAEPGVRVVPYSNAEAVVRPVDGVFQALEDHGIVVLELEVPGDSR